MRHVALSFAAILLLAAYPGAGQSTYDECPASPTVANPCARVTTDQNVGGVTPPAQAAKTYYLWGAAAKCAPTFQSECSGRPTEGNGIGFVGVLYEETNRLGGLQRRLTEIGTVDYAPDVAVLV